MANTISDAMNRPNGLLPDVKAKAIEAEAGLEKMSKDMGKSIGAMTSRISNSAADYTKSGTEYVAHNPVKGVAIAAATGAIVGSILTMAMRRK